MNHSIEYGHPGERSSAKAYEMPAVSLQPLLLALGLGLIFAGLIYVHALVYVGAAAVLISAVGWWRQVVPVEEHELVPLNSKRRPSLITVGERSVSRLKVGEHGHRVQIPENSQPYSAGIAGGLAGAAAMAVLACLYGLIAQGSLWYPINLLAGVVMPDLGHASMEQLRSFNGPAFAAAAGGHIVLSMLVGVLYAVMLPMFPKYAPLWAGIMMPLFWSGVTATLLNLINPALNQHISWIAFVCCQLGFGLVCGYVISRSAPIKTMQSWTLAERAFLDAPGLSEEHARED